MSCRGVTKSRRRGRRAALASRRRDRPLRRVSATVLLGRLGDAQGIARPEAPGRTEMAVPRASRPPGSSGSPSPRAVLVSARSRRAALGEASWPTGRPASGGLAPSAGTPRTLSQPTDNTHPPTRAGAGLGAVKTGPHRAVRCHRGGAEEEAVTECLAVGRVDEGLAGVVHRRAPEAGAFSEDVTTLGNVAVEVRAVGGAQVGERYLPSLAHRDRHAPA